MKNILNIIYQEVRINGAKDETNLQGKLVTWTQILQLSNQALLYDTWKLRLKYFNRLIFFRKKISAAYRNVYSMHKHAHTQQYYLYV